MRAAFQRYLRRFIPAMLTYTVVLVASVVLLDEFGARMPTWLRAVIAIAPVLPVGVVCWAVVGFVRDCDEFERRVELESIALASLWVGMGYLSVGFLAVAEVISLNGGIAALWVLPLLFGTYGVAKWFTLRRYQ